MSSRVVHAKPSRVFVAVSGGVDSAVALALLARGGYDVTGVFMQNWSRTVPGLSCNWAGEREDAARVCASLGVPFRTVNLEEAYRMRVFDNFIKEYRRGRTPNPDVLCNSEVKFKAFMGFALREGANAIATGHYARIARRGGRIALRAGMDANKDQSYFLYRLHEHELSKALFPVGGMTKPAVRALARKFRIPVAEKKDSQGVCFVGDVALPAFLRNWIPEREGEVRRLPAGRMARNREKLARAGAHRGAWYYTIGQRRGLGLPGGGVPLYVAQKDVKKNLLFVAEKTHPALWTRDVTLGEVTWVAGEAPAFPFSCRVRIRYRQPLQSCRVSRPVGGQGRLMVRFAKPQWAAAPGQSVVFYRGSELLGGGIIHA